MPASGHDLGGEGSPPRRREEKRRRGFLGGRWWSHLCGTLNWGDPSDTIWWRCRLNARTYCMLYVLALKITKPSHSEFIKNWFGVLLCCVLVRLHSTQGVFNPLQCNPSTANCDKCLTLTLTQTLILTLTLTTTTLTLTTTILTPTLATTTLTLNAHAGTLSLAARYRCVK